MLNMRPYIGPRVIIRTHLVEGPLVGAKFQISGLFFQGTHLVEGPLVGAKFQISGLFFQGAKFQISGLFFQIREFSFRKSLDLVMQRTGTIL